VKVVFGISTPREDVNDVQEAPPQKRKRAKYNMESAATGAGLLTGVFVIENNDDEWFQTAAN